MWLRRRDGALGVAGALHLLQLAAELGDLGVDPAPVGLDLGLTGTAATDALAARGAAAGLAGQVAAPAAEPLLHVAELGQLDLRLALLGLRVLGEDVEDQRGPVDDLDLEPVLEVAQLARRELAVADHGVRAGGRDDLADGVDLAAPDVRRRVGPAAPLEDVVEHLRAGGLGEQRELGHGVLGVLDRALGPHADEHDPLQAELPVLDLGDVLELGTQPGDPAELVALGQVLLAGRQVVGGLGVRLVGVAADEVVVVPVGGLVERGVETEVVCVGHGPLRVGRAAARRDRLSGPTAARPWRFPESPARCSGSGTGAGPAPAGGRRAPASRGGTGRGTPATGRRAVPAAARSPGGRATAAAP